MDDQSTLLQALQIPRDERGQQPGSVSLRFVLVASLTISVLLGGFWYANGIEEPVAEQTVTTPTSSIAIIPPDLGTLSVLDAAGYVTARRQATVSSKITGRIASART